MRVEIWCRYLLKVESCVMLNVFCHLTVEFINTRIFRTLRHEYLSDSLLFFDEILEFNSIWHPLQTLQVSEKNSYNPQSYGRLNGIFNFDLACHVFICIERLRFDINSATLSRPVGTKFQFFCMCREGPFV